MSRSNPALSLPSRAIVRGLLLLALAGSAKVALAADWLQFRGPGGSGVSDDKGLPVEWSDDKNIVWKQEMPGPGGSSPIIVGDRIFLTSYSGYGLAQDNPGDMQDLRLHVVCLNRASGEPLWQKEITPQAPDQNYRDFLALHGYASSTPCSDGERLYVFFGHTGVFCFDLEGNRIWNVSVGENTHGWGSATSPVLHGNVVIVNASVESGALVGLDKRTGAELWRAAGIQRAWNSPVVATSPEGRAEVVISSAKELKAFDPETGALLWTCAGIEDYVCPSVIIRDGVVYALGGRGKNGVAVRMGGNGDVSKSHLLYRIPGFTNVSSPAFHKGHLYWIHDSAGIAYCANAATGEIVYEKRISPNPDRVYASAVLADDKLYYVSRTEGAYCVAAEPEFKLLAHNRLEGDSSVFNGSPAVSDGQLLLRSDRYLYCIGDK